MTCTTLIQLIYRNNSSLKVSWPNTLEVVSFTLYIVQSLDHYHFDPVTLLLPLEPIKLVSETLTQMAAELIKYHLMPVLQKR